MNRNLMHCLTWLGCLALVSANIGCHKAESPSHDEIIRADLVAILELQGLRCNQVVGHTMDQRMDYRVECATGDVYRIHISAEGHVNVNNPENAGSE